MKKDLLARAGRLATLGRRSFGLREGDFSAYLADIRTEAKRAFERYGMLVVPGAEITQNRIRGHKNSHVIALDIKEYISADQRADEILREIRRQGALSIACHPHHRTTRRVEISTCYLWDHRDELSSLVDVWEAANRDDLFSVTSLKHYRTSPTAISTSRSISIRGRRWCAATSPGPPSGRRFAPTPTSRSRCSAMDRGPASRVSDVTPLFAGHCGRAAAETAHRFRWDAVTARYLAGYNELSFGGRMASVQDYAVWQPRRLDGPPDSSGSTRTYGLHRAAISARVCTERDCRFHQP